MKIETSLKKKQLIVLFLAVSAVGLGPFLVSGVIMEQAILQAIDDTNEAFNDKSADSPIAIASYDRGIFNTTIEWTVKTDLLKQCCGTDEIIFVDRARHGLSGVVSRTSLEKNPWYAEVVSRHKGDREPIEIETIYSYLGTLSTTINIGEFTLGNNDKCWKIKPGNLTVDYDLRRETITTEAAWQGATSVANALSIRMITFSSSLRRFSNFLWNGLSKLSIGSILIRNNPEKLIITNTEASLLLDLEPDSNLLEIRTAIDLGKLENTQKQMKNASLKFEINKINAARFEKAVTIFSNAFGKTLNNTAGNGTGPASRLAKLKQQMPALHLRLAAAYEAMLTKGLEIKVTDLTAILPEGSVEGHGWVRLERNMTLAGFIPVLWRPGLLFNIISLETYLKVPEVLIQDERRATTPVISGMQTGLFLRADNSYVVTGA